MRDNTNPYASSDDYNPFQAPENPFHDDGLHNASAEAIRNEYLSHEASVKSVGLLYMIGGVVMILSVAGMIFAMANNGLGGAGPIELILLPALAIGQCVVAVGLRRLKRWARLPGGLLAFFGLFFFPVGTIVNGYVLYLLCSARGTMVFSEEYQDIMQQTPHIKYRTSPVVWFFLILLLVLIAFGLIAAFFAG